MKVLLKRVYHSRLGRFGKIEDGVSRKVPVEMPDALRDELPRDAEIVGEEYDPPGEMAVEEPVSLAKAADQYGIDTDKTSVEELQRVQDEMAVEQAEQDRLARAKKFQEDLAAEKPIKSGKKSKKS